METGLEGKTIVVTGAGAGIGLATARMLREEGAHVVAADLDVAAIVDAGDDHLVPFVADLGEADSPARAVELAVARYGRVDGLVNNVGIAPLRTGFQEITDADWTTTFNMNLFCMLRASRAALAHMVRQGSGAIVNIASEVARQPDVFLFDYSVSKAAVLSFSKVLSMEFGQYGIRVNAVSPGPTRTSAWDRPGGFVDHLAEELGVGREAAVEHFAKEIRRLPLGRVGMPEDVAGAIVFLLSDRGRQITGSDYCVDSGVKRAA